jgi:vacuolar-type H+-ATPase subunit H
MTNPIQIVLDAETKAQQQVEREEQAAQNRVRQARQQARDIINRNEARTSKVAKRYEALCQRTLSEKIDAMLDKAESGLDQFTHLSTANRDGIVEAVFLSLSPASFSVGKPDD